MKRNQILSLLLALCLFMTSAFGTGPAVIPVYADTTASDVAETVTTFTDALTKLTSKTEELNKIGKILERFGGVTAAVSGGIAILELVGITEDETEAQLDEILGEVKNVQDQVKQMDAKLDDISKQLVALSVSTEEKDRQNRAMTVLSYWRKFKTDYVDPLDDDLRDYPSKLSVAVDSWWSDSGRHKDTCVLYTDTEEGAALAYSRENGFPDTVNNTERINKDLSFCVPKAVLDQIVAGAGSYDKESYKDKFRVTAAAQLSQAISKKKLTFASNANKNAFYTAWNALDDTAKEDRADRYAQDLLNTLISRIAIEAMSDSANQTWVTNVMNHYAKYCENIRIKDSGIDALITVQYMTHGFEGEVSGDINKIIDSAIASAGYYGALALSVSGQDIKHKSAADTNKVRDNMISTINFLETKRGKALTGNPNYCYIAGAPLSFTTMNLNSSLTSRYDKVVKRGVDKVRVVDNSASPWKLCTTDGQEARLPEYVNDTWMLVLYHYYLQQKDGNQAFAGFLSENGVNIPSDYNGKLMTRYGGSSNFSLTENLKMKAIHMYGKEFTSGKTYTINDKDSTDVKDKYIKIHDKVTCNDLDLATGNFEVNQIAAARAAYYEDHWYWYYDEGTAFTLNAEVLNNSSESLKEEGIWRHTDQLSFTAPVSMLVLSASSGVKAAAVTLEETDDTDTLHAFDNAAYMELEEEEEEGAEGKSASWEPDSLDKLEEYGSDDGQMEDAIDQEISAALDAAAGTEQTIELNESDRAVIRKKMEDMIWDLQEDLAANNGLVCLDVFHIDGSSEMEKKLLDAVLPGLSNYYDVSDENINTIAFYEAGATIRFNGTGSNYSYEIRPAYDIEPVLILWDPYTEEYIYFEISNEVMKELGLTMSLRIPATAIADGSNITVRHYDSIYGLNLLKEHVLEVQGDGNDRYVELEVDQCSPFEIQEGLQSDVVRVISKEDKEWTGTRGNIPAVKKLVVKSAKKSLLVRWKKLSKKKLKKFTRVEIQVCPNKKFKKTDTIRRQIKKSRKSIRIKGLKRKTAYYVRARNVKGSGSKKTVSKWTGIKRIRTR